MNKNMVNIVGGNITDTISGYVGQINPKWLKIFGMILVIVSIICVVSLLMAFFSGKRSLTLDVALDGLMYVISFIAGIYMWKSGGNALMGHI